MRSFASAGVGVLLLVQIASAGEPATQSATSAKTSKADEQTQRPHEPIARQYAQILAEYQAQQMARARYLAKPADKREGPVMRGPNLVTYNRRMVDLAESSPKDPAARDALLWVLNQPGHSDMSPAYGDLFARAGALLVRYHGDDPEAVRIGLTLDNAVTPRRDALLLGFYAAAKGREAKGLARLALAQYLARRAAHVVYARGVEGRPKIRAIGGGKVIRESDMSDEHFAYHLQLRQCDPEVIRAEAERLFEEVIAEYGDILHVTRRQRDIEALLKEPAPVLNGKSITDEDRRSLEGRLTLQKTLAQVAEDKLDDWLNLAVGKPAPEIEGVDVDGKRFKLSDFRGKIVALVFWGSWCGPCMAQIPAERKFAERLKDQPFALLGVDCEPDKEVARETMARERMTWPNWFDGARGEGPIADRYHIRRYPSVIVLDAEGIIRSRAPWTEDLERNVVQLLQELKHPPAVNTREGKSSLESNNP
jgi:thiol-disulfide isomerase/thioredoxin